MLANPDSAKALSDYHHYAEEEDEDAMCGNDTTSLLSTMTAESEKTLKGPRAQPRSPSSRKSSLASILTASGTTLNGGTSIRGKSLVHLAYALGDNAGDFYTWRKLSSLHDQYSIGRRDSACFPYDYFLFLASCLKTTELRKRALHLRLTVVHLRITQTYSWFSRYPHEFREVMAEVDNIYILGKALEIADDTLSHITKLRKELIMQLVLDFPLCIDETVLRSLVIELDIVAFLCYELAYGDGNAHLVQTALQSCAATHFGRLEIDRLERAGDLVYCALTRLLYDFNNVYSRHRAFRIFGRLARSQNNGRLRILIEGPLGIKHIVDELKCYVAPVYSVRCSSYRALGARCDALVSACLSGFIDEVVEAGVCEPLVRILHANVARDVDVCGLVREEESDDPDVEFNQLHLIQLIYVILADGGSARHALVEAGIASLLQRFSAHTNRLYAAVALKFTLDLCITLMKDDMGWPGMQGKSRDMMDTDETLL